MLTRLAVGKVSAIAWLAVWAGCGEPPLGESSSAVATVPITLSLRIDCPQGSGTLGTITVVKGTAEYFDPSNTRVDFATTTQAAGPVVCVPGTTILVPLFPVKLAAGSPIVTLVPLGTNVCDPSPLARLFDLAIGACAFGPGNASCAVPAIPSACVEF